VVSICGGWGARAAYYEKFPYLGWMPGWRTANTEANYRKTLIRLRFAGALLLSSGVSIVFCTFLILFLVLVHSSHGPFIAGGVFLITFASLFRLTFYFSRDTSCGGPDSSKTPVSSTPSVR
jgi:hypothetical protein